MVMTMRSLEQLKAWSMRARDDPTLVQIAREYSPHQSHRRALELTENEEMARETRWLSMIRRDHGEAEFEKWVFPY